MSTNPHKHTILYADDDQDDVFLVQQAFRKYDGSVDLIHATDGIEALDKLQQTESKETRPCLIILDINMPGMDGREALVRIKQTSFLKNIPVVLFSTSSSENDRTFAARWGAEFITKPLIYSELELLADTFLNFCQSVKAKV